MVNCVYINIGVNNEVKVVVSFDVGMWSRNWIVAAIAAIPAVREVREYVGERIKFGKLNYHFVLT